VFRILKREGLVRCIEVPVPASNEYRHKTTAPHQLWATDASYFRVAGWGYYYMVTVLDDFSRFILAWRLQVDMTTPSLIEVVQDAVDLTGMTDVQVEDRTRLLSDNGSGYVSRLFREYLQLVGIRHVLAAPYHPQTNGKLERYHQTLKRDVNQLPYDVPRELEVAIGKFVDFYNYRRYHKALKDIIPADMLAGRQNEILGRRREAKDRTITRRKLSNQALREQLKPA
jgi:putative transposase